MAKEVSRENRITIIPLIISVIALLSGASFHEYRIRAENV